MRLEGRSAIVTGGATGIGKHYCHALAAEGAQVMIADIQDGKAVAEEIAAKYGRNSTASMKFDVSDEAQCKALVAKTLERFGKIDILVNNAGATWGAPAEQHPLEAWDKLVNVNLSGAFVLTQIIAVKSMIPAKWGRIINVASIAGLMGQDPRFAPTVAYTATKHGLVGLTRQLAAEWGVHGITVNAICPGFFPSKMTRATLDTAGALIKEWTPTRRFGGDEDLKGLAVLLASEASRHITGQAIAVDGGSSII
jgi:gluconate 5-dehydrogenase